ncbi:winged helix-turn-helix domain-containing protein [Enterovirga rhinocerotis]|uniref:winged helix-turn-helix domain-containing protein n=1 Tax=Enterovirga rhinocerotis TaxID=1339210 RepID=UPI001FE068FA|nr:winged helix-turn-helix transcriptional regulator [Enterovirga rhinocerotis]
MSAEEIGDADARRAGYASAAELRNELSGRPEGQLYRIAVRLVSADPRIALRADDRLGAEEIATLQTRLDRLDGAEPWTRRAMELVASEPGLRAADLAEAVGLDKPAFKARMRKLKALGLTESLDVGYRLSPRGRSLLKGLGDTERCS